MSYKWKITKDHIANEKVVYPSNDNAVGMIGPSDCNEDLDPVVSGEEFRMYDDDGNIYYTGFICGDYDGFEPLDDFGTPNAGAVDIQYKVEGEWQTL